VGIDISISMYMLLGRNEDETKILYSLDISMKMKINFLFQN